MKCIICGFFTKLFTIIKTVSRSYGLTVFKIFITLACSMLTHVGRERLVLFHIVLTAYAPFLFQL